MAFCGIWAAVCGMYLGYFLYTFLNPNDAHEFAKIAVVQTHLAFCHLSYSAWFLVAIIFRVSDTDDFYACSDQWFLP